MVLPVKRVCHFSCGAASAVATKLTLQNSDLPVEINNVYLEEEHKDNQRFLKDCEAWFGVNIRQHRDTKYNASIYEVFRRVRFIKSAYGAACTARLKRAVFSAITTADSIIIIGFTADKADQDRWERMLDSNPDLMLEAPLIEANLNKQDCISIIAAQGIEIPVMYKKGYHNNNCIGCVKGRMGYWNKIKIDFPEVFWEMVAIQDLIGPESYFWEGDENWDGSLRHLPPDKGHYPSELSIQCGVVCMIQDMKFSDMPIVRKR